MLIIQVHDLAPTYHDYFHVFTSWFLFLDPILFLTSFSLSCSYSYIHHLWRMVSFYISCYSQLVNILCFFSVFFPYKAMLLCLVWCRKICGLTTEIEGILPHDALLFLSFFFLLSSYTYVVDKLRGALLVQTWTKEGGLASGRVSGHLLFCHL